MPIWDQKPKQKAAQKIAGKRDMVCIFLYLLLEEANQPTKSAVYPESWSATTVQSLCPRSQLCTQKHANSCDKLGNWQMHPIDDPNSSRDYALI